MKFLDKKAFLLTVNNMILDHWNMVNVVATEDATYLVLEKDEELKELVFVVNADIWDSL